MKKNIFKRLGGLMAFLMLLSQLSFPVNAQEEYTCWENDCFTSGDVTGDCMITPQDSLRIINHLTDLEAGYDACLDVNQDGIVSPYDSLVPINNISAGVQCPASCGSDDSSIEEGDDNETSMAEGGGTGDAEQVEDDEMSDDDAEDHTVEGIVEMLSDMTETDAAQTLEVLEEDIETAVDDLEGTLSETPELSKDIREKIENLLALRARIRAEALRRQAGLREMVQKVKELPRVYSVRWGNLDARRQACFGISLRMIEDSLDDGEIPGRCRPEDPINYLGKLSVDRGELKIYKEILFEDDDAVKDASGTSVSFDSVIAGHWDGIIMVYTPDSDDDGSGGPIETTISIGDLEETYTGAEVLGRKMIGNGHMIEIRQLGRILPGLDSEQQTTLIQELVDIQTKLNGLRGKLDRLRLMNRGGEAVDELEELADEIGDYNFDEEGSEEIQQFVDRTTGLLDNASGSEIAIRARNLRDRLAQIREKARQRKFAQNLIPFKDTDDNEWYTGYVSAVKNRGIIGGYKDAAGNPLGEYRPGNNITVAEILKIGLETAGKDEADGTPDLPGTQNHWAKGYVKKAENMGLDLVEEDVDLNRPATRGEVIRLMLEALGIKPSAVSSVDFSDVPASHPHAAFIQYAKELGIISGDAGTTNFRPDAPINRAEAAKISDLINSIILGGVDS